MSSSHQISCYNKAVVLRAAAAAKPERETKRGTAQCGLCVAHILLLFKMTYIPLLATQVAKQGMHD